MYSVPLTWSAEKKAVIKNEPNYLAHNLNRNNGEVELTKSFVWKMTPKDCPWKGKDCPWKGKDCP